MASSRPRKTVTRTRTRARRGDGGSAWLMLVPAGLAVLVLLVAFVPHGPARPGLGATFAQAAQVVAPPPAAPAAGDGQVRALWVDAFHDGVKNQAQVDRLIADAQASGINTLIVQVRRRGDAYYNRSAEPRTEDATLRPGFDVLQATIERAHVAHPRIEVHAWMATVALWSRRDRPPLDPRHAFNRHGPDAPGGENWISLDDRDEAWDGENFMLDPGHPDAARYIADVAGEIVREYDVDGLHLDLVRYAGAQWGYNPVSVARYNRRWDTSGKPRPNDPRWQQWRRDQVTALVRRIYLDTLAVKPAVKVSAATIGWGSGPVDERTWRTTSAYRNVFQDWLGWIEDGIVDVVMPMNYDNDNVPAQRAWFNQWMTWQKTRRGQRQVVAGVGLFLNEPGAGLDQIRRALTPTPSGARLDGVALYSYAVSNAPGRGGDGPATASGDLLRSLVQPSVWGGDGSPPFATPAAPPPMPWKENPGAHVRGQVRRVGDDGARGGAFDGALVRLSGPQAVTLTADGNGYFGAPGLRPGRYAVSVTYDGQTLATLAVELRTGEVQTLDVVTG